MSSSDTPPANQNDNQNNEHALSQRAPSGEAETSKGVLSGQEGIILQRAGEELRLQKVSNRLSFCLSDASALNALAATWQPKTAREITPQGAANDHLIVEWQLNKKQLEDALSALRSDSTVLYASHVYELAVSPNTYVYLGNELTVQFAQDRMLYPTALTPISFESVQRLVKIRSNFLMISLAILKC